MPTARSDNSPRWITLWGARNLPALPCLRWSEYSSVRFVPIWIATEPVSTSANSSQSTAPPVAASADPTSTGAMDAVSENGRAAQNQETSLGCGAGVEEFTAIGKDAPSVAISNHP